ncbi:hypothetical protein V8C86DRAFT_2682935, partial [Haematococcus lacustris]
MTCAIILDTVYWHPTAAMACGIPLACARPHPWCKRQGGWTMQANMAAPDDVCCRWHTVMEVDQSPSIFNSPALQPGAT